MSHFLVGAIIPEEVLTDNIELYINRVMEPYNEDRVMAPYKRFHSEEDTARMREFYIKQGKKVDTLEDLLLLMKDWDGDEGGIEDGKLFYWSQYNPDSQWDWFVIGGRWDGVIKGSRRESEDNGFNFGDNHHQLEHNIAFLKDVIADTERRPFAFVTPEGRWLERGDMGWWGIVTDEKPEEDWLNTLDELKAKYGHHRVVGLDCHI